MRLGNQVFQQLHHGTGELAFAFQGARHLRGEFGLVQQDLEGLPIPALVQQQAKPFADEVLQRSLWATGQLATLLDQLLQRHLGVGQHRFVQLVLALEVPVNRATAEAGGLGDHRQGGVRIAVAAEQLESRGDDLEAGLFGVFFGTAHVGPQMMRGGSARTHCATARRG